jgi:hypothetical protein
VAALYLGSSALWGLSYAVSVWHGLIPSVTRLGIEAAFDLIWIFPPLILILTLQFLNDLA